MAHALLSDSTDVHSTGQMAAEKAAKEAVTHPEVKERPGDATERAKRGHGRRVVAHGRPRCLHGAPMVAHKIFLQFIRPRRKK